MAHCTTVVRCDFNGSLLREMAAMDKMHRSGANANGKREGRKRVNANNLQREEAQSLFSLHFPFPAECSFAKIRW